MLFFSFWTVLDSFLTTRVSSKDLDLLLLFMFSFFYYYYIKILYQHVKFIFFCMKLLKKQQQQKINMYVSNNGDLNIFFETSFHAGRHLIIIFCWIFNCVSNLFFVRWLSVEFLWCIMKKCTTRHAKIDWMTLFETFIRNI